MLGHWKNFDELESSLSILELNAVLGAMRKKQENEMQFQAAINGVDINSNNDSEDISELNGRRASQEGFGSGEGLGFLEL